ncbi:MAG: ABC transporter ATP-binding protein [Spirochaetota bacterium]
MALLKMEHITKVFPGVVANDSITFTLNTGEVHALVGENGAGKTTLMKILYGLHKPDSGSIVINDKQISIKNPKDAIRQGIGMVHQHFMLIPPFTVLENIVLGEETHLSGLLRHSEPELKIKELMQENKLNVDLAAKVEELPVGIQQRVEILKILYRKATILVFDEPTAVLTPQEAAELFKTFAEMKKQGKGIIFISHKLDEVLNIADRITVIRRGKVIQTLNIKEATKALIAELMVGKPVLLKVDNPEIEKGDIILDIRDLSFVNERGIQVLSEINISIHGGEIYGIAGVEGNGQMELVQAIASKMNLKSGEILLSGHTIKDLDIRKRREAGLGHIPEDRQKYGLLLSFPLSDNMVLGRHHKSPFVKRFQIINKQEIKKFAREKIEKFDVRTPSEMIPANALSGGNQQKLIVARELSADPKLLVASQPTRGLDIGATEFIYQQLVGAKAAGKAVLLVSADLDEIMSLSDTIGVIYKGKIIKEFKRSETTKEEVGYYMMGEKVHEEAKV